MTSKHFTTSVAMERRAEAAMAGKPPVMRRMGLLVPEEQRMRVDGFIYILPRGAERRLALSVVTELRGRHDNFTDEEYFSGLATAIRSRRILEEDITGRIESMPVSQRGNAFRVALERKAADKSPYCNLDFYGDLVADAKENVPGEKQQAIIAKMRSYAEEARQKGILDGDGANAALHSFEEWLGQADIRSVNLLYYFSDRIDRIMEASLRAHSKEFVRVVQDGLPKIADFDPLGGKAQGMRVHYLDYAANRIANGGAA